MVKVILFSGYFINHDELCELIGQSDVSDREIVSVGFNKWGASFLLKLNGLFSFALKEENRERYYCCRDRFGGKGLYYAWNRDNCPVFSETIQGLLQETKQRASFREEMLEIYLSYSYIPGEDTAFDGIRKPLPGYLYTFDGGQISKQRYFTPRFREENHAEDKWRELLANTLDTIFGEIESGGSSLLSSGIDSSYLCKRLAVHDTYTAKYDDSAFSESELAGIFSKNMGAAHHALGITAEEYLATVPMTMRAVEQPTGDASAEVLFHSCQKIRENTDSCYSGEGIDELFLGYYMDDVRKIPESQTLFDAGYIGTTDILTEEEKKRFLKNYTPSRKMNYVREAYAISEQASRLHQAATVDLLVWLNGNLLPNVFGIGKATGLRLRTPYFDNRLYDIALTIPAELNNDTVSTKKLFRRAVGMVLDNEDAMRPKRGFPVPVRLWMRRPDYIKRLTQAFMSDTAFRFFHQNELLAYYDAMLSNPRDTESWRVIWCIYCFIVWYDEMININKPETD